MSTGRFRRVQSRRMMLASAGALTAGVAGLSMVGCGGSGNGHTSSSSGAQQAATSQGGGQPRPPQRAEANLPPPRRAAVSLPRLQSAGGSGSWPSRRVQTFRTSTRSRACSRLAGPCGTGWATSSYDGPSPIQGRLNRTSRLRCPSSRTRPRSSSRPTRPPSGSSELLSTGARSRRMT